MHNNKLQLEAKDHILITDDMIDESSIKIWTFFSDKAIIDIINKLKNVPNKKTLFEDIEKPLNGKDWRELPFWRKVTDWITPGTNSDGTYKGWFTDRTFPTKTIKATELTANKIIKTIDDGFNIKVDYTGATDEQKRAASDLISKAFDREFLIAHAQGAKDVSNVVGAVTGGAVGTHGGGVVGGAVTGVGSKGAILNKEQELIDQYNDTVKGTPAEDLAITPEDCHQDWFDQFSKYVVSHPYISIATVVGLVALFKYRTWIWDRLKLASNNLFQGTVIAKYQFALIDGTELSFEYDLRFNKWRLLYKSFQWKDDAYPSESMIKSFIKTQHCRKFIKKLTEYANNFFKYEKQLTLVFNDNKNKSNISSVKMIKKVLDDRLDIDQSMLSLKYKVS